MKIGILIIIVSFLIYSCSENEKNAVKDKPAQPKIIDKLINDVRKNPENSSLRMQLINTLDSLKMYKKAISETDSLIKRDSLNNALWYAKAQLQEDNGDTTAAIKSYTRAANIYPSPEVQLHLANLLAETKNKEALIICADLKKSGMGRETDADCNFIAGVYYARTGAGRQAIQLFDQAINDNYTLMEAYMEKGFIYYDNKKFAEALKVFETAITVNQTYADAYYWRAKCSEALGNKSDAVIDYKRSLGLDKDLKEARQAIQRLK